MGMELAFSTQAHVESLTCGNCGMVFWVDQHWLKEKRDTGGSFHCPNGHPRVFRKSEADRLRELLKAKEEELARERTRVELRDRTNAALRGQVTKIKNRVQNGVCPCCNRTFGNLGRHMAAKHPDWKGQEIG